MGHSVQSTEFCYLKIIGYQDLDTVDFILQVSQHDGDYEAHLKKEWREGSRGTTDGSELQELNERLETETVVYPERNT